MKIRLTESQLKRMIAESVKEVLKESHINGDVYTSALEITKKIMGLMVNKLHIDPETAKGHILKVFNIWDPSDLVDGEDEAAKFNNWEDMPLGNENAYDVNEGEDPDDVAYNLVGDALWDLVAKHHIDARTAAHYIKKAFKRNYTADLVGGAI